MFHKIKEISATDDYTLIARFECDTRKQYDMKPLFAQMPIFLALKEVPNLFAQVQVDIGGYGISWNDDLDLSCEELWEQGTSISDDKIA